jgi:hypothetical protein
MGVTKLQGNSSFIGGGGFLLNVVRWSTDQGRSIKHHTFKSTVGLAVHTCNPSTWGTEAEDGEFEASLGYRVRPVSKTKKKKTKILGQAWWCRPVIPVT